MKKFIKDHRFIAGLLSILISVFLVSIVAYGVTTIGTNVTTEGYATSTTGLFTQANIYAGGSATTSLSHYIGGTASTTELFVQGAGHIGGALSIDGTVTANGDVSIIGAATTTLSHYIGGTASTTELFVQGDAHVGGNTTIDGRTTTTDYIYLPMVHFQQGVVTSTAPNEGECFMPDNDLACYADGAWVYAW